MIKELESNNLLSIPVREDYDSERDEDQVDDCSMQSVEKRRH